VGLDVYVGPLSRYCAGKVVTAAVFLELAEKSATRRLPMCLDF
jgi:hypothetical protein